MQGANVYIGKVDEYKVLRFQDPESQISVAMHFDKQAWSAFKESINGVSGVHSAGVEALPR